MEHISTAYQIGNAEGMAQEKIERSSNQHFNNVYEETKYIAEVLVSESGLNYAIYRPGIVIGANNGRTLSFDGYYTYQRSFWVFKNLILNRLNRDSNFYNGSGIRTESEKLILPVRIKSSFDANLNLVPVDWLAKKVVELSEKELSRKRVFHLIHPMPPLIKWVILTSLDIMGIGGVELINPDQSTSQDNDQLNEIQQMVDKGIADYEAYTNQNHQFDDYQTVLLLNSEYQPPPPIDRAFLARTLTYAIKHKFKRSI